MPIMAFCLSFKIHKGEHCSMKTLILFLLVVLITIVIGAIGFIFSKFETLAAIFLTIFVLLFGFFLIVYFGSIYEKYTTLKNPLTISLEDAGKMFRVVDIREKCVGLTLWGRTEFGLQEDLTLIPIYYLIENIPKELLNCGQLFKVESTNKGLAYKKVVFYGNKNKQKPFEVFDLVN